MDKDNNVILKIPFAMAAAIMRTKGVNVLGEAIFLKNAEAAGGIASPATKEMEDVAEALARPSLASGLYIVEEDDSFTHTRLILKDDGRICFVSKEVEGFIATPLMEKNEAFVGLQNRLDGGMPVVQMKVLFELPLADFYILLAAADLYVRKRMLSSLSHGVPDLSINEGEILQILCDGIASQDPRWLVSFIDLIIPHSKEIINEKMVSEALKRLKDIGIVSSSMKSLEGAGMLLAITHYRRLCMLGFDLAGAGSDGSFAAQRSVFLRGDRLLWFIDDATGTGGGISVSTICMDEAKAIINEFFTPEGTPAGADISQKSYECVAMTDSKECEPKESSGDKCQTRRFCSGCGKPLKSGVKFCGSCGMRYKDG